MLGVTRTSAADAGFLIALNVVFTPIVEGMVHRRWPGWGWPGWGLAGAVLLGLVGTALLTAMGSTTLSAGNAAYLAVLSTFVAFYVQLVAIRRTSASRVALLLGTEPLWAALSAVGLGGEMLPLQGWLSGGILVAATFWGRWAESRRWEEPDDDNRRRSRHDPRTYYGDNARC